MKLWKARQTQLLAPQSRGSTNPHQQLAAKRWTKFNRESEPGNFGLPDKSALKDNGPPENSSPRTSKHQPTWTNSNSSDLTYPQQQNRAFIRPRYDLYRMPIQAKGLQPPYSIHRAHPAHNCHTHYHMKLKQTCEVLGCEWRPNARRSGQRHENHHRPEAVGTDKLKLVMLESSLANAMTKIRTRAQSQVIRFQLRHNITTADFGEKPTQDIRAWTANFRSTVRRHSKRPLKRHRRPLFNTHARPYGSRTLSPSTNHLRAPTHNPLPW